MTASSKTDTKIAQKHLEICVDRDGWTKGLQLSVDCRDDNGWGLGYRLAGPKFNGSSSSILRHRLTERDANELRRYLDVAFPAPEGRRS